MTFIVAIFAYFLRLNGSVILLLVSTIMFGFSIALGNVALPSFFKRLGSSRIAILSSAYTASLYLGPAIATALTLPIKHLFSISWNEMSLAWIFIPVLSILLIVFFASNKSVSIENKTVVSNEGDERLERTINPWISIPCWIMAIYFAFLSFNFFIITAWFPELISSYGLSETKSAFYASLFPLIAIPFATLSSFYIYKIKQQKILFFINPIIVTTGILILVYGDNSLIPIAISIMGVGAGICTGIAFLLPLLRFNNTANVTKANAMMQSMGYLIAFCGPLVSGYAHDFTGSWTIVLWICALTLFIQSVLGIAIGKNEKFDQDELES
ncbi:hypothetical protein A9255_09185 [Xenorhabdus hominickii]|nr:hypothetical protein A9255_09185 [Xenorhabdus hominickii]